MKGITPWEILPDVYFSKNLSWQFQCQDQTTSDIDKLNEFWLPDQHDLQVRVTINFEGWDEKMNRVFADSDHIRWVISWNSSGTKLCGSSELFSHHPDLMDISCVIPMGSCASNLSLTPAALTLRGLPDENGIYSIPPGAILTDIDPLFIEFGHAAAFPLFEIFHDGKQLLKWSFSAEISENLHEDMARLISVEVDMNHEFIKTNTVESEVVSRQKKGLLYNLIIGDYLRIICAEPETLIAVEEGDFVEGSAGYSIKQLLSEIADSNNITRLSDLHSFFQNKPTEVNRITDSFFSSLF